jgi:myosin-5
MQLFAAPESVKASLYISTLSCRDFMYTCQGDTRTDTIEGVTDGARFLTTMTTLGLIGVTGALQQQIREIIIGIVFMGQICFSGDADTSSISSAVSEETIERCCSLLGLDVIAFKKRVIVRNIEAAGDTLSVALSREQATDGRDALAKDAYTRLFMWLVSIINESTAASETDTQRNRIIGLLDIFGFESFRVNRFEQLCINYTNEKLQAKFTSDVLMSVQAEYREEGLDWETIDYKDNNDVLELLESRLGFIALLNEECLLPKGSNGNFLNKISSAFQKNYLFSLSVLKSK